MQKQTVLSDSLAMELNIRAGNVPKEVSLPWRFEVCETTCAKEDCDCDCELIGVTWHSRLTCPDHPFRKTWTVEEVQQRRSIGDFAQSIIDSLVSTETT